MLCSTTFVNAQVEVSTYEMSTFETEPYSIQATEPKNGEFNYYIDMQSLDGAVSSGGVTIKSKNIDEFVLFLIECQSKLNEWNEVAKANGVEELTKEIPVTVKPSVDGYFKYGDWQFDNYVNLNPVYLRTENVASVVIYTGELTSTSNEYIDCENLAFALNSSEISALLKNIDKATVLSFFSEKDNKEDLFK